MRKRFRAAEPVPRVETPLDPRGAQHDITLIDGTRTFISYASENKQFASKLVHDLELSGVRCWWDEEHLRIGDRHWERIRDAIRVCNNAVLICSANSAESEWVKREVGWLLEREKRDRRTTLFPISIDDTIFHATEGWPAEILETRFIGDFRHWRGDKSYREAFDRLLRSLGREISPGSIH